MGSGLRGAGLACPAVRRGILRFLRAVTAVAAMLAVVTACRVDVEVGIDAEADGSGRVRVEVVADKELADSVDLSAGVRVDDLRQAGWSVETARQPDGGFRVVATKPFDDTEGARLAVEEVSGPTGPFQDFRLEQSRSFARTTTRFTGTVDFARGIEAFGDPGVREALGGSDVGVDLARLEQVLNGPVDRAVGVRVAVRLPGEVESNAPQATSNGARWELRLRDRVDLTAESTAWNLTNLAGAAAAVLATVALLAVLVASRRRPGVTRRRR